MDLEVNVMKVNEIKKKVVSNIAVIDEKRVVMIGSRKVMQACATVAAESYASGGTQKFGVVCRDDRNVMGFYSIEKDAKESQVVIRTDIGEDELQLLVDRANAALDALRDGNGHAVSEVAA